MGRRGLWERGCPCLADVCTKFVSYWNTFIAVYCFSLSNRICAHSVSNSYSVWVINIDTLVLNFNRTKIKTVELRSFKASHWLTLMAIAYFLEQNCLESVPFQHNNFLINNYYNILLSRCNNLLFASHPVDPMCSSPHLLSIRDSSPMSSACQSNH